MAASDLERFLVYARPFELPFVSIFPAANGSLTGERFHFDLAALCEQISLPLDALRERLAPLRGARDAAPEARRA